MPETPLQLSPAALQAEARRERMAEEILGLCAEIDEACDREIWTRSALDDYINRKWEVLYGLDSLTAESLPQLKADLSARLQRAKARPVAASA